MRAESVSAAGFVESRRKSDKKRWGRRGLEIGKLTDSVSVEREGTLTLILQQLDFSVFVVVLRSTQDKTRGQKIKVAFVHATATRKNKIKM